MRSPATRGSDLAQEGGVVGELDRVLDGEARGSSQVAADDEGGDLDDLPVTAGLGPVCSVWPARRSTASRSTARLRRVLVPATMGLVGRANWWLPGWLDRILPHLDLEAAPPVDPEGDRTEPDPERELVAA